MKRLEDLFKRKPAGILNVYVTAGYPELDSTLPMLKTLQDSGADIIELGMPYSDPLADGPVIQQSGLIIFHARPGSRWHAFQFFYEGLERCPRIFLLHEMFTDQETIKSR